MKIIGSQFRLSVGKLISKLLASFPFWGTLLIVTGMGLSSPSAETLTYTDLNGDTEIHALELTTLFKNTEDYTIYAYGETNQTDWDGTSETYLNFSVSLSGIYSDGNEQPIENSGDLEIFAFGGEGTGDINYAYTNLAIYGIETTIDVMALENNGNIIITAKGGTAYADIVAGASVRAYGIDDDDYTPDEIEDTKVINTGNICINAEGGTAQGSLAGASATGYGLNLYKRGDVESSGTIEVTCTGGTAKGGTSSASAEATAIGINMSSAINLKNTGDIIVHAKGGTAENEKNGTDNDLYSEVDAYAYACGIKLSRSGIITNLGNITATAASGTISGGTSTNANSAFAYGILDSSSDGIINKGDIYVSAVSDAASQTHPAKAVGLNLGGRYGDMSRYLTNSGNISAYAEGPDASAYGIYIDPGQDGMLSLTNTGMIRASATSSAYEVYINSGTVTLSNTYNLVLDGSPEVGSIYIAPDAVLDLNNTKLTLSYVDDEFQWNTPYKIFDNDGTISNGFGAVSAVNPNVTANYLDQDTTDASDDAVSLSYGRANVSSPFTQSSGLLGKSMVLNGGALDRHILSSFLAGTTDGNAVRIADSGQTASDAGQGYFKTPRKWEFFTMPYYSRLDNDDPFTGYHAKSLGTSFGLKRKTRTGLYGVHLGYGNSDVDYTLSGLEGSEEEMDLFSAGMHALGRVDQWILRLRMTGFKGQSDYQGLTGLNLTMRETAEYDTYGISSSLTGGYLFKIGSHTLLPGIGLNHIWTHRDSFTTQAETAAWDLTVDSLDEHQVTALADIEWLSRFETKSMALIPSVSAGVRHLLTDNELSITQSLAGTTPFTATTFQDDFTLALAASLLIETNRDMTMEIAYDGGYGDTTDRHSLWGRISFYF